MKLYHVTTKDKAKNIIKEGFDSSHPVSELGVIGDIDENDEFPSNEENPTLYIRDTFNEFLSNAANGKPDHNSSVFFNSDLDKAIDLKNTMEKNTHEPYSMISVDTKNIPCKCQQANTHKVGELWDTIEEDELTAHRCLNMGIDEDEDKEGFEKCNLLDQLAKEYYDTMTDLKKPDPDMEVLCPCDIPKNGLELMFQDKQKKIDKWL